MLDINTLLDMFLAAIQNPNIEFKVKQKFFIEFLHLIKMLDDRVKNKRLEAGNNLASPYKSIYDDFREIDDIFHTAKDCVFYVITEDKIPEKQSDLERLAFEIVSLYKKYKRCCEAFEWFAEQVDGEGQQYRV